MRCSICNMKIDNQVVIPNKFHDLCATCTKSVVKTALDSVPLSEKRQIVHRFAVEGLQEPTVYTDN